MDPPPSDEFVQVESGVAVVEMLDMSQTKRKAAAQPPHHHQEEEKQAMTAPAEVQAEVERREVEVAPQGSRTGTVSGDQPILLSGLTLAEAKSDHPERESPESIGGSSTVVHLQAEVARWQAMRASSVALGKTLQKAIRKKDVEMTEAKAAASQAIITALKEKEAAEGQIVELQVGVAKLLREKDALREERDALAAEKQAAVHQHAASEQAHQARASAAQQRHRELEDQVARLMWSLAQLQAEDDQAALECLMKKFDQAEALLERVRVLGMGSEAGHGDSSMRGKKRGKK